MTTALVNCSERGMAASQRRYKGAGLRLKTSEIASVSKRKGNEASVELCPRPGSRPAQAGKSLDEILRSFPTTCEAREPPRWSGGAKPFQLLELRRGHESNDWLPMACDHDCAPCLDSPHAVREVRLDFSDRKFFGQATPPIGQMDHIDLNACSSRAAGLADVVKRCLSA